MADELFQRTEQESVHVVELKVPAEIDPLVIDRLIESVVAVVAPQASERWVLDLTKVSYLNSAGLGLLCNVREKVRQGKGKLVLCGLSPQLLQLFKSCCLERLFVIAKTFPEALAAAKN